MKSIPFLFITLFFLGCTHDHHSHEQIELDPAPSVQLKAIKEDSGAYNVQVVLDGMEFAPESVGLDHVLGQGHAHLYVDHKKILRVYSEWVYVPRGLIPNGAKELSVTLSTNDHKEVAVNGELVTDTVKLTP